jgi:hypothetical protein
MLKTQLIILSDHSFWRLYFPLQKGAKVISMLLALKSNSEKAYHSHLRQTSNP